MDSKLFELYCTISDFSYESDIVKARELMIDIVKILKYDVDIDNNNIHVINHFINKSKEKAKAAIYKQMITHQHNH